MTIIMDFFFNHNSIYIMILFLFLTWKVDFVVKILFFKTFGQELNGSTLGKCFIFLKL